MSLFLPSRHFCAENIEIFFYEIKLKLSENKHMFIFIIYVIFSTCSNANGEFV